MNIPVPKPTNAHNDQDSFGHTGRGGFGRGGGRFSGRFSNSQGGFGSGRGNGDGRGRNLQGHGDDRSHQKSLGAIYMKAGISVPSHISEKHCMDWATMGRYCSKPRGMCAGHYSFDRNMPPDVKTPFINWVMATEGVWFNKDAVRNLPEEHKWKLGDDSGH